MSWLDSMAKGSGAAGGGTSVGIAQGQIRIDTASLAQARAVVIRESRLMGSSLRSIGPEAEAGVKQAESAYKRLSTSVNGVHRSLSTLLGAIAVMGVRSAQSVKVLNARFALLSGSQEKAAKQLKELRDLAEDLNQPFLEIAEGATAIMPALRGTNASLNDTLMLVQRLAILDPVQGIAGASFAVREFLNGEYLSLVRRLELDRKRLQQIRAEAGGDPRKMIEGLSAYIDELGVTNQSLKEMGQSGANAFRVLRSEGTETLAVFFEPFLNEVLIPITRAFGDFLRGLRQLSPELQRFIGISAGLASLGALGGNLPLVGRIPGGAMIGKAGVLGAAAYGGAQLGATVSRAAGLPGTAGKSNEEILGNAWTSLKKAIFLVAYGFAQFYKAEISVAEDIDNVWDDYLKPAWDKVVAGLNQMVRDLIDTLNKLPGITLTKPVNWDENVPGMGGPSARSNMLMGRNEFLRGGGQNLMDDMAQRAFAAFHSTGQKVAQSGEKAASEWDQARQSVDEFLVTLAEGMGIVEEAGPNFFQTMRDSVKGALDMMKAAAPEDVSPITITDELLAGWQQYKDDLAQIDADAQQASLDETRDYEERKAEITRNFNESVQRMLEEEAIRYARALADTQRREREIRSSLQEQLTRANVELGKSIADLNERHYKDQERATRDHLRALREIQEDGRDSIFKAAMQLDAKGILEATMAMQRRLEDEKEGFQTEQADRRTQLAEAITAERESYAERVQLAKDNATKQIAQLWEQFNREEQLRREDNARKLLLMQQDFQAEIAELGVEHQRKLADIIQQAAQEKKARDDAWIKEFNAAQTHNEAMLGIQKAGQKQLEDELLAWWKNMSAQFNAAQNAMTAVSTAGTSIMGALSFPTGGRLPRTGLFRGEQDEEVLRPDTANWLRRAMGGEISQSGLMAAVAGRGGGGRLIDVGGIVVNFPEVAGGWSKPEVRDFVMETVLDAFEAAGASA